jgi:hypothetical protein
MPMKPVASVAEAIQTIDAFSGPASDFLLAFPDELNDPIGINLAIVTDRILARGWCPAGFTQFSGYRVLRYAPLE